MTKWTSVVYAENNIELSWLIGLGMLYDESQTRKQCDQSIGLLYAEIKTELLGTI